MVKLADTQVKVLRLLYGNPPMLPRSVIDSTGLRPHAALAAINALRLAQLIVERPGGSYEITEPGREGPARKDVLMSVDRYSKGNWSKSELRKLKKQISERHGTGPRAQEGARREFMDAQAGGAKQRQRTRQTYGMAMLEPERTS